MSNDTKHENSILYFAKMAALAPVKYVRDYWLRRKKGAEDLQKQLEARRKAKEALKQREENLNSFKNCLAPEIRLESHHPLGCVVFWEKPENWEPDTYMVMVREEKEESSPRSVSSKMIDRDSRQMVLTKSYFSWGEYKEPYFISVRAVKNGVGVKESIKLRYPPKPIEEPVKPIEEPIEEPVEKPVEKPVEYEKNLEDKSLKVQKEKEEKEEKEDKKEKKEVLLKPLEKEKEKQEDTKKLKAFEKAVDNFSKVVKKLDEVEKRENLILEMMKRYTGKRNKKGLPVMKFLRKQCPLDPPITFKERAKAFRKFKKLENTKD